VAIIGYGQDGYGLIYDGINTTELSAWDADLEQSLLVFSVDGNKAYIDLNVGAPALFVNAVPATTTVVKKIRVDFVSSGIKIYRDDVLVTTI